MNLMKCIIGEERCDKKKSEILSVITTIIIIIITEESVSVKSCGSKKYMRDEEITRDFRLLSCFSLSLSFSIGCSLDTRVEFEKRFLLFLCQRRWYKKSMVWKKGQNEKRASTPALDEMQEEESQERNFSRRKY